MMALQVSILLPFRVEGVTNTVNPVVLITVPTVISVFGHLSNRIRAGLYNFDGHPSVMGLHTITMNRIPVKRHQSFGQSKSVARLITLVLGLVVALVTVFVLVNCSDSSDRKSYGYWRAL
ncbi:hypothetical protein WBG78_04570 [Chryseolinea sp. T2]|uniref:hypothetical protein n=1 Tax=Chryseolinea sp. T2 TaxID=3129255 RepID=UPI003076B64A